MGDKSSGWQMVPADGEAVSRVEKELSVPHAIARILVSRGITQTEQAEKYFRKSLSDLTSPFELSGMKQASDRLANAVLREEKILVQGDFDADGITASACLSLFLRELGAQVIPFVPNRLLEGHGISLRAIEMAKREGVSLFITCDCGTSSAAEIRQLIDLGIDTIVTDHHEITGEFPSRAILVNPKLHVGKTEQEDLSGVGVAYMLAAATRSTLRDLGFFQNRAEPNLKAYLDIVALGTLADMAPLKGQNRILVAHGLQQIYLSKRPGFLAMKEKAGLTDSASILVEDVGFRLAPRINAAARLGNADAALELLMTSDYSKAEELANSIEGWNETRKSKQETMTRLASVEAQRQVESGRKSIVVSSNDFHPGIIGLVAQKLSQMYSRPAFVFAEEEEVSKGSARAHGPWNLTEAIGCCSELLLGFGGHREAGGCSLETKNLRAFEKRFEEAIANQNYAASQEILIDAELNLRHLNEEVVRFLEDLGPFGIGNLEPVFLTGAKIVGVPREVGKGHLKLSLADVSGVGVFAGIGFDLWQKWKGMSGNLEVAYTPEVNLWKGRRHIQVRLRGFQSV